jgi:omega-6 fatty acid desaturase (delta-12 desaturase)
MPQVDIFSLRHSNLNPFLFADVGAERNGETLRVVSVFARQDKDPCREAGLLAALPSVGAIEKLAVTIAGMPNSIWTLPDATKIATRLVALLPTHPSGGVSDGGGRARRRTNFLIVATLLFALALAVGRVIGFWILLRADPSPFQEFCSMHEIPQSDAEPGSVARRRLMAAIAHFQSPSPNLSLFQAGSTLLLYFSLLAAMYAGCGVVGWLALLPAPLAAGLMVRIFVIQHDCGHGALFRSRRANNMLGRMCSLVTLTPYAFWRRQHAQHHGVWNNLDTRTSAADIYSGCFTVAEYHALPRMRRLLHRVAMHPVVAQVLIPPVLFMVIYRIPFETQAGWRRERASIALTNVALAAVFTGLVLWRGVGPVAAVQLPVIFIASVVGAWLFSIQHRFEGVRWFRRGTWEPLGASLDGCSYLKLPGVLEWFTGSIGFHHIHHLAPRIPNYRLRACHEAMPELSTAAHGLTLRQALASWRHALWDEEQGRMVPFPA